MRNSGLKEMIETPKYMEFDWTGHHLGKYRCVPRSLGADRQSGHYACLEEEIGMEIPYHGLWQQVADPT